jgi:hypothetical protein
MGNKNKRNGFGRYVPIGGTPSGARELNPFDRIVMSFGLLPEKPAHRLFATELLRLREKKRLQVPVPQPKKPISAQTKKPPYEPSPWERLVYDHVKKDYFPAPPETKPIQPLISNKVSIGEYTLKGKKVTVHLISGKKRKRGTKRKP